MNLLSPLTLPLTPIYLGSSPPRPVEFHILSAPSILTWDGLNSGLEMEKGITRHKPKVYRGPETDTSQLSQRSVLVQETAYTEQ